MLVPLIMAIWFGYTARRAGRNWFAWAIGGAVLAFIVATIVPNVGAAMFGPFTLDNYIPFRIISSIVAVVITIIVGSQLVARIGKKDVQSDASSTEPGHATSKDGPPVVDTRTGVCPSCGKPAAFSSRKCPNCSADFGPGSAYQVLPARGDA